MFELVYEALITMRKVFSSELEYLICPIRLFDTNIHAKAIRLPHERMRG